MEEKTSSETRLSFTWRGDGKYHHKKRFHPFFCRALSDFLHLGLLLFKQDSQKQCQV